MANITCDFSMLSVMFHVIHVISNTNNRELQIIEQI